ncbi:MAG: 30S ribosomal protein S1 [Holosporaceae bacterium]|jgi:small subunit ribosomal protein S1|nr:30S ribosomal protein S1 [Holosporaceae bacterium]
MTEKSGAFAELFERDGRAVIYAEKVVKGVVVSIDDNFITMDVGLKSEGRIAASEFTHGGKKIELRVGDKIDVFIERYENKTGEIMLSREKALREAAWSDFEKAFKEGACITGVMYNRVKGGFMVDLGEVTAFLPSSQVDTWPVKDVAPLMNSKQQFVIIKMDKPRENIVVSRRGAMKGADADSRAKVLDGLEEGQELNGIVKNITNYGAFVDIGGIDGLLHSVDMSWKRINHPSEMLSPGQSIKVAVIKCDKEARRISLGMKQLTSDPWSGIAEEFAVGSRIKGKVTNVTDYGLFVEVKEGVEGLVYVSEISWKKSTHPAKVASVGDEMEVVVLDVDMAKRRMGLGLKQLQTNPWGHIAQNFPVDHVFEGTISNITDFGIFVKVHDEIDGMVHLNDVSWDLSEALTSYKKGDVVTVKVLDIDMEKERISLGIKQLIKKPDDGPSSSVKSGDIITCIVKAIETSGIEVTLPNGATGNIKKTELAKDRQDRRIDRFAVGEKVDAKVLSVDKTGRKVILSIRALEIEEEQQAMAEYGSSDSGASLGDILGLAMGKKNGEN